jgi:hypothetical protein
VDEDTQIESEGVIVGEVLGDDGEDGPAMQTARLVRSRRRLVSYVACEAGAAAGRYAEACEPAEYRGASELAVMACVEESAGAESMPLSE